MFVHLIVDKQFVRATPLQRGLTACRVCAIIQHAVAVPLSLHIPRFQAWGSNPNQDNFFALFLLPLSATANQWRIFLKNFIDWLTWVVIQVTSQKIALTGIRTPDLEPKIWCGTRTATVCWIAAHARYSVKPLEMAMVWKTGLNRADLGPDSRPDQSGPVRNLNRSFRTGPTSDQNPLNRSRNYGYRQNWFRILVGKHLAQ